LSSSYYTKLDELTLVQHPEVPWSQIIGMRNILTHNYFEIDLDVVWFVVERDLPNLKLQIEAILRALS
ncbi:MAG: hypothetical protein C4323_02700, partial [Mastigocladus sp. ERB_26_2]